MKKKLKFIPIILIIIFLALFYAYQNGYYEKYSRDKINLTNKNIEQFEKDILDGKDVSIEDYLEEEKSYETKTGSISLKISSKLENTINKGIKLIFKKISKFVE
ncbi:MAG: hypothetical protein IKN63_05030 [Bacilli bacterium]|nr:hypothetical protein [Bacilli bacterium]